jgi:hypothetical protein
MKPADIVVIYRYARFGLSTAAASFLVYVSWRAVAAGGSLADASWLLIVLLLFAVFGGAYLQRTRAIKERAAYEELVRASEARRLAGSAAGGRHGATPKRS